MDNTGSQLASFCREAADMVQQRVHQRAGLYARAHVNRHPGRLVHHHQVFIFINNIERQVLR